MNKNVTAFQEYLLREKNYSDLTVVAYINDLGFFLSFLKSEFDDYTLEEVHYSQIRSWIVSLSERGISNFGFDHSELPSKYSRQIRFSGMIKKNLNH